MKTFVPLVLLLAVGLTLVPQVTLAVTLVPCGRSDQTGTADAQCNFTHLIILLSRLINYLISFAAFVAIYYILLAGWSMMTSVGNEEKVKKAKTGISNAVVGFGIIVLGFVFVNLLVNGLLGDRNPNVIRKWWDPACVFDITNSPNGCPLSGGGTP